MGNFVINEGIRPEKVAKDLDLKLDGTRLWNSGTYMAEIGMVGDKLMLTIGDGQVSFKIKVLLERARRLPYAKEKDWKKKAK